MLLIGAGLTIRSLVKLQQVDPGFTTDNILTFRIDLNFTKYDGRRKRGLFWRRVSEDAQTAVPGVAKRRRSAARSHSTNGRRSLSRS